MSRSSVLAFTFFVGLLWPGDWSFGQSTPDFHEFTDKRGQKVSAILVAVAADRRQMKIVRNDGKEFDMVINLLSLDDQQYVKDWLKSRPAVATGSGGYRLEVSIARAVGDTRKHKYSDDSYSMEEKDHLFRISVKNLSRETLVSARLEYAVVWDNAVVLYQEDTGEWRYSMNSADEPPDRAKFVGGTDLSNLRFNGVNPVDTAVVSIDRVLYDGNELLREDELIGVKVRISTPDGLVIHEAQSGGAEIESMTWEEIQTIEDPRKVK